jgi:hypothetical protein
MARISNREIIGKYRSKIEQSRRWRREENCDYLWERMIDLYRGKHLRTASEQDQLLVNIAFATINVISPSVSVNHPKITVNARAYEDADKAVVTEAIVNYWWKHYECQKEFRRAVKDMLVVGHGWLKTGYRFVEKDKEDFDSTDELASLTPESMTESELIITEDRPFVERVSMFDVFVDPDGTNMSDIKWIAQRIRRPLKEVKKDKRYDSKARQEAQPSHYSKWSIDERAPRRSEDPEDAYVEIWEFYDLDRQTMSIFCDGGDRFLVNPSEIPFAFGHPFVMLRNYEIPEYFYPMGELEAIEPLQMELNETRTQMMNHRKRFSRKWLYKESAFDQEGRSALESDEDNVMVPVVSEEPLGNVITPMPAVISPPEFYNQSTLISSDIDRVSGVSEYMRGALPEIRRTATEAAIAQDAANARASDKLAIIERCIADCARRLVMMAQQYMEGEQVVRIVGNETKPAWLKFDKDYVKGEFDFDVEGGSTAPTNESFRRQMALQVVDAMAPFVGAGIIDMPKLANYVLQYGFGIKNSASFVVQASMPAQPVTPQGLPQMAPGGMPPMGMTPDSGMPPEMTQGLEEMPPTGGMPMPSGIPPEILSQLLASGAPLPNTQLPV